LDTNYIGTTAANPKPYTFGTTDNLAGCITGKPNPLLTVLVGVLLPNLG